MNLSRRGFLLGCGAGVLAGCVARRPGSPRQRLVFDVRADFGAASPEDVEAVARSAADSIWNHCPDTRWETRGFRLYQNDPYPITLDEHQDGFIAIGLTPKGTYWAQFAYQFAHEFGHALAGHSNDFAEIRGHDRGKNHWLEESLCELASLFALRAMGESWKTSPPYPNWKSFAPHLTSYAAERIATAEKNRGDRPFAEWFRSAEPALRETSTLRDKNTIVAVHLLPLFEKTPSGWEALTFFRRGRTGGETSLAAHLAGWRASCPARLRGFVTTIGDRMC